MKMATIIRVKRRIQDEPEDAMIVKFKRRRLNSEELKEESKVLTYLGSVKKVEETNTEVKKILKRTKQEITSEFMRKKRQPQELRNKLRKQKERHSQQNRYRMVGELRNFNLTEGSTDEERIHCDLLDIVVEADPKPSVAQVTSEITCNGQPLVEVRDEHIYDLYMADEERDWGSDIMSDLLSFHPYNNIPLLDDDDLYQSENESDDSNAENYYKNDYPDGEESEEDDDLNRMLRDFSLGGCEVYEALAYNPDDDQYDTYKKKVLKDLYGVASSDDSSEDNNSDHFNPYKNSRDVYLSVSSDDD